MKTTKTIRHAKLYIFDLDGTILDSMPEWEHLGRNYLLHRGVNPPEDLEQILDKMTMEESAAYFQTLGIPGDIDEISREVLSYIQDAYRLSIPAKPGMTELLQTLSQKQDSILCLLTTSKRECAVNALTRLNILSCFQDIHTSSELGLGKTTGEIYQRVCDIYHTAPSDTVVFEDAAYAVRSAREAGCYVYAVPDQTSAEAWTQICSMADDVLTLSL